MKVNELIKLLKTMPQNMDVVVGSDDEGNSFRFIPNGWVSVEKFDMGLNIISEEYYESYTPDDYVNYVCVG